MKIKRIIFISFFAFLFFQQIIFSQTSPGYFLPDDIKFNKEVPTPAEILGYNVGEMHVSHDQLVSYFSVLSQKSRRVKYEIYGRTHEGRPLTMAIISSEENIRNIEDIRKRHLQICDPDFSPSMNLEDQPVVIWLSHSIHGNEASGANSAMLTAYYFAAGLGNEIDELLRSTVILIDPSANPDGLQRFSTWVNSHKSNQVNTDPLSREHLEAWPGGRSNHYWFDLNRDWLPVEQPESESRIIKLGEWKPNILVDLHEMGSNSTFHFSPGEPARVNPLIPAANQELTKKLAEGYSKAFDNIGSLYFSGEQFDDYYIGRGPTYMDMNGGVSLLFEQASARGFAQNTENGLLTFPFTIKNQLTGALSSVKTAFRLRNEFLTYQRNYYLTAISEARKITKKAYIFGSEFDKNTTFHLAHLLKTHGISSYLPGKDLNTGKHFFKSSCSYIVPLDQPQFRLIESIFETRTTFRDSIFYDVSAWNIPMAYNIPFESLDARLFTADTRGEAFSQLQKPTGKIIGNGSVYAYAIKWTDYNSPSALYKLLDGNIRVKVATKPIETLTGEKLERGTIIIPLGRVNEDTTTLNHILLEVSQKYGLDIIKLNTGDNRKSDLGSPTLVNIEKPRILVLTEEGVSGFSAGQLWHQFDTRYDIPVTLLPLRLLASVNLYNYNVLIVPDGNYRTVDTKTVEKIQGWVAAGNTIIGLERASVWLAENKFINADFKSQDLIKAADYENSMLYAASQEVPGTIYESVADLTHPLFYGYINNHIPVYKDNKIVQIIKYMDPLNYPAHYSQSPLIDGYSPRGFAGDIAGTPTCSVFPYRMGRVMAFYNNPVFRAYWRGSNKLLANAVFFNKAIRFSSQVDQ